jgi:Peptidase family M23
VGHTEPVVRVLAAAGVAACALPAVAHAYGWPVKPFDRQHAVRGSFDDPRQDMLKDGQPQYSFHSGIDVSAPNGTPVYAVAAGWVSHRADAVVVASPGGHTFGYWHVRATVRAGTFVRLHQLVGHVEAPWAHVHLSESVAGVYVNPLRSGGIAPYVDHTAPTIDDVQLLSNGRRASILGVSGDVDFVASAYDTPPVAPPGEWAATRVTPALLRWRLTYEGRTVVAWRTAIDFRLHILPSSLFGSVFAGSTVQNRAARPGHYAFYLARSVDTRRYGNGVYALEVFAADTRGNTTTVTLPFRIAN